MEIDRLVQEKRLQIRDAFAAHQKAREAVAHIRKHLSGLVRTVGAESARAEPGVVRLGEVQIKELESEERNAEARFKAISEDLAQLHRKKYGEWHITWIGPRS